MNHLIFPANAFFCRIFSLYLFLCLSFSACSQQPDKATRSEVEESHQHHAIVQTKIAGEDAEVKGLQTQVLTLHDEAMVLMDDIMELRYKAKARLHPLQITQVSTHTTIDSSEKAKEEKRHLEQMMKELNQAHQLMMDWMRKYDAKMEKMTTEEKIAYLKKEKDSIGQVKQKMFWTVDKCKLSLNYLLR